MVSDAKQIEDFFGKRCDTVDENCAACFSWNMYDRKEIMKKAIWKMASKRYDNIDDYIMIAKQAIADYEAIGGSYGD